MGYNVGITFGGYCPMHQGHLECIMEAKKHNDMVFVVVCGYDNEPRAIELGLSYEKRLRMIQDYFRDDEIIKVIGINDTELGIDESMSFSNWYVWLDAVMKQIYRHVSKTLIDETKIYVGEKKYAEDILKLDTLISPVLVGYDKKAGKRINNISATDVRKHPQKYWNKILPPFKSYLTKKILITGTASEGKTTLVHDLGRYFQCPITTEYGRDYMSTLGLKDTDLTFTDFVSFITGQNWYYKKALCSSGNNGVIISDTDNLVTLMYAKAYSEMPEMKINSDDYLALYDLVKRLDKDLVITWDKIFVLPPKNNFVDDGMRFMGQASMDERQKNFEKLMALIDDFGLTDKVEVLFSDYAGNFNRVKEYINSLYA